ncbi:hypothetical protein OWR29_42405 [Actinoplanes sp. Pm04-4]|uniref:Uncharacterized protein n=1 Tax=Paractinoplanes pyxinae TaxID=2997416 RepID=A0ABT4BDV0_9ACTN|nr:hypothetical protein [Actinoplanes pyxinae]MCY1144693.1 hypothetical protein [Actinoplanes pyxinae]
MADTSVVHLILDRVGRKTVPSRLSPAHLRQLLTDGGRPAGAPSVSTGRVGPGDAIEVERTINVTGLLAVAGRQHPVSFHFAGRRVTVRGDHGVLPFVSPSAAFRVSAGDELLLEVPRTTTKQIARFKVRKPEPTRPSRDRDRFRV